MFLFKQNIFILSFTNLCKILFPLEFVTTYALNAELFSQNVLRNFQLTVTHNMKFQSIFKLTIKACAL